jgi:hypothetical protein
MLSANAEPARLNRLLPLCLEALTATTLLEGLAQKKIPRQ